MGARLMVALDQARLLVRAGEADPLLVIHLGPHVLTGFAVRLPDGTPLTVGLVGARAAPAGLREALARGVAAG